MGNACVSKSKSSQNHQERSIKTQPEKSPSPALISNIDKREVQLLKLIYKDIASRSANKELSLENFLQFFHKNGYWGERLFKQFDTTQTTSITQTEFINGITKIFKTSEQKRIEKLYKFFSENKIQEGITFSNFLKMLYNYPKQDLKIILNDQQFINNQVRQYLVAVDSQLNGRRLQSLNPTDMKNVIVNGKTFRLSESQSSSQWQQNKFMDKYKSETNLKNEDHRTSWKIAIGDNDVEIKTTSIHHLVKKYAKSIFKHYNIDEKTGKFGYRQFRDWIINHKKLYNVYYEGFHCQAWQFNQKEQCPAYLTQKMQHSSKAKLLIRNNVRDVSLYLIHSILIICAEQNKKCPISIVCLEGLTVSQIFDNKYGNGIEISHRQGFYESKNLFFFNEEVQQQWMEHLRFYKGMSINQLYEIKQKIGTGRFSIVYNGIQKSTSENYAIKQITVHKLDNEAKKILSHETNIMKVLSHPLLVFFKETVATKTHVYIITQLVKGKDLFDLVHEYKYLEENEAAFVMEQVIVGVRYIHSLGIVHRDLKPENIMVQFDSKDCYIGRVKIIDFGFADYISHLHEASKQQLLVGTPNYIAPQILRSQPFDQKIDNFAIGGILYYLLSGAYCFGNKDTISILTRTMLSQYTLEGKKWQKVSDQAKDLVQKLLQTNPSQRISLQKALNHPWFVKHKQQKQNKAGIKLSKKGQEEKGEKRLQQCQQIKLN